MEFTLNDVRDDNPCQLKGTVVLEKGGLGLHIRVEGYGDHDSIQGHGVPVILEICEGKLRLLVWRDINNEDPQIIELGGADENKRWACDDGTLTVGDVKKYCDGNGISCLFCGSNDLNCGEWDTSDTMVCRQVICGACGKEWTDEYKLAGVSQDGSEISS